MGPAGKITTALRLSETKSRLILSALVKTQSNVFQAGIKPVVGMHSKHAS